jgi:GTP-binding protein LepA
MAVDRARIRNFSIIAHIDHGKSTLADRIIEYTGAISEREMRDQVLDSLDLERERGITIKAHAMRIYYTAHDGLAYELNLLDTPGHVDFTYEVSRSLAACEGALLVVDATQGVEAQTFANVYLALEKNLEIIPVVNKIDLANANPQEILRQIHDFIGLEVTNAILASAKLGIGTKEILEAIVTRIPPPRGEVGRTLRALVFDSTYDVYRGVVVYVRVVDGALAPGDRIRFFTTLDEYEIAEVGYFSPKMTPVPRLSSGEVGYLIAGIKNISSIQIGDTVTSAHEPAPEPLPGYKEVKPVVFAGVYPQDNDDYDALKQAIEKLKLNDSSFTVEADNSEALGYGFRCGFLGLLHMEIFQERLEREFGLALIITAPSVRFRVELTDGEKTFVDNPSKLPPLNVTRSIEEPLIVGRIFIPAKYLGAILKLLQEKKGIQKNLQYVSEERVMLVYELPLSEVIVDFYDKLKSYSQGYASFDYDFLGYRAGDLVKLDVLINGAPVDALSSIVHREDAHRRGKELATKLRKVIPRQLYEVAIQAAVGGKVIARETVVALRKNVTAKCYGGDITRKRKLLDRQKEGKRRMKRVGKVSIPQEAFISLLKID